MAEYVTDDLRIFSLSNQKSIYVGNAAPGIAYDGMHWVDISTDPLVVKVYDLTNTDWMTMYPIYYETQVGAWAAPTQSPITNGTIVVLYNSDETATRLYGRSNGAWVNFAGTIVRANPVYDDGDVQEEPLFASNGINTSHITVVGAGATVTLLTGEVVVAEDNGVVILAGGAHVYRINSASDWRLELWLDGSMVANSVNFGNQDIITMSYNTTKNAGTYATNLKVTDTGADDGNLYASGSHLYSFAVKT